MAIEIYCTQHKTNHHLTTTQTEQLVYGLSAHLCDEETAPTDCYPNEDPTEHLYGFCVLAELNLALDGEGYAEHVYNMQDSRRALQQPQSRLQHLPECPACANWVCSACGWNRNRAARLSPQHCHRCQGTKGTFQPVHHSDQATREDHLDAFLRETRQPPAPSVES